MALYALIRNGMGDVDLGTGAEEDDFLYATNYYLLQDGRIDSGDFAVSQRAAGANMSVDVAKGRIFIPNTSYVVNTDGETKYWPALNTAVANLTVTANSSGNPRIDIVVVTMNEATAPDDEATNVIELSVVAGTPAGSPSAPATPANSYKLAEIAVANGAVSVVTANITDTRNYAYLNLSKGYIPNNERMYFLDSDGNPYSYFLMDASENTYFVQGGASKTFSFLDNSSVSIVSIGGANRVFDLNYGTRLDIFDAANTDYIRLSHDGTNALFDINVGAYVFRGTSAQNVAYISDNGLFIENSAYLLIHSHGNDKEFKLSHNDTNAVIDVSSGSLVITPAGGIVSVEKSGVQNYIRSFDSALTKYVSIYHEGTNGYFLSTSGSAVLSGASSVYLEPGSDGNKIIFARLPRRVNNSSSTYPNSHIQSGWAYVEGDNTPAIDISVSFPIAFSSDNVRVITSYCGSAGSAPSDEGDFTNFNAVVATETKNITTNGFSCQMYNVQLGILPSGSYFGFMWIAIGPV